MPTPIVLPELGAGDAVVSVSSWFVAVGERVEAGDWVVEVQLPGTTFDVSAPIAGVVARKEKLVGATIRTGEVLGWLET
ncbi:MAG: lipoyl domain-containing protein [Planctomycetaceae bacterium]